MRFVLLAAAATLLVACGEDAAPTPASDGAPPAPEPASSVLAAPSSAPTVAPDAWSVPRLDVEPGLLVVDFAQREGWSPGPDGRARGALLPLHPETAEELPGYRPLDGDWVSTRVPSPDGRLLALIRQATTTYYSPRVHLVDAREWVDLGEIEDAPALDMLAWSTDSRHLYGTLRHHRRSVPRWTEVWRIDVETGAAELVAEGDFDTWDSPGLSPDGSTVYLTAFRAADCCGIDVQGDPFIAVVDLDSGTIDEIALPGVRIGQGIERHVDGEHDIGVSLRPATALTPDGRRLFVAHADEDRVTAVDLEQRVVVRAFQPAPRQPALSRLGSWLLGHVVERADAKGLGLSFVKQAAVTPDGRWLLVSGTRDELCKGETDFPCLSSLPIGLQVIDVETLELVAEFEGIGRFEVSADGRWIVGTGLAADSRDRDASWATEVGHGITVLDAATLEVVGSTEPDAVYYQLVTGADERFAYAIKPAPGYYDARENGWRCDDPCFHLQVLSLPDAQVVAQRDLFDSVALLRLH